MNDERERRAMPRKLREHIRRHAERRQADLGDLRRWMITDLCRFYRLADFVRDDDETDGSWVFSVETAGHRYTIAAREARGDDRGRLSCVAESEGGETRTIASGPLSDHVWESIVRDIVSLELVPVGDVKPVKRSPAQVPFATPEMVESLGTIPLIAGGEDDEDDGDEDQNEL